MFFVILLALFNDSIVDTIGSVDDLIEKYEEINLSIKNFRKTFFKRFYDNLPIEREQDLSKIIYLESGSQPPKSEHIYEYKQGYIRFIQNRDYSNESHKTYIKISNKNKVCSVSDILIDKYGEAGTIRYGLTGAYNVALAKVIPKNTNMLEFLRDFLSQKSISEILYQSSQASTRPSLNESSLTGIKIKIPVGKDLNEYEQTMSKFLSQELIICNKISTLRNTKQLLLQKYFG